MHINCIEAVQTSQLVLLVAKACNLCFSGKVGDCILGFHGAKSTRTIKVREEQSWAKP